MPDEIGAQDLWQSLRGSTQARIGLGRSGDAQRTQSVLEFRAAHALARDAVHQPLDLAGLTRQVAALGLGAPAVVTSQASSRSEYLRRPDLGRLPADLSAISASGAELGIVLCDGLSPTALTQHGAGLLAALAAVLGKRYTIAPPVIATEARVALGDHIGAAMGVQTVIVLIGERPGLSVAASVGMYLTHLPRPGRPDADRNCVSNVHPPEGLAYTDAARVIAGLVAGARQLGRSGVDLKDTSRADSLAAGKPQPRVVATVAACDLLRTLRDRNGGLMLHQSGGCCDGSSPMCYLDGEFIVGDRDVLLGILDLAAEPGQTPVALPEGADAVPVWISGPQFDAWRHTQLILDVVPGRGGGFSLEAPEGYRFLTRSRVFGPAELAEFDAAPPLVGAEVESGARPPVPAFSVVVADGEAAGAACALP